MRIIQYINIFWYCGLDLRNEPLSEFKLIYKPITPENHKHVVFSEKIKLDYFAQIRLSVKENLEAT